jgi:hypothetical protein
MQNDMRDRLVKDGGIIKRAIIEYFEQRIATDNDVVPVVRCKNCKFFDMSSRHCDHPMSTSIPISRSSTGYCSYGERKEE